MYITGDYLIPRLQGIVHIHKPPLIYWVTALGYRLFGINEWGARVFQGVFALAVLGLIFLFGRKFLGFWSGLFASLVLLLTPGFLGAERNLTTDMLLLFCVTGALTCFFAYLKERKKSYLLFLYFFIALSLITKGPMGVVVIVPVIVTNLAFERRLNLLKNLLSPGGIALAAIISLPWYLLMAIKVPGFIDYIVKVQVLGRITGNGIGHPHPWYYFLGVFPLLTLPWLPFAIARGVRIMRKGKIHSEWGVTLFLLIWAFLPPLIFSLPATKLPLYVLPSLPPVAMLAGKEIDEMLTESKATRLALAPHLYFLLSGLSLLTLPLLSKGHKSAIVKSIPQSFTLPLAAFLLVGGMIGMMRWRNARHTLTTAFLTFSLFLGFLVGSLDKLPLPTVKEVAFRIKTAAPDFCPPIVEEGTVISGLSFYTGCPVYEEKVSRDLRFEEGLTPYVVDLKVLQTIIDKGEQVVLVKKGDLPTGEFPEEEISPLGSNLFFASFDLHRKNYRTFPEGGKGEGTFRSNPSLR
ncbi:MAG: glycosyltransferase family 39 protein [Deltaproteobacteria bacterium]|nr:MAG: glycosyltransferase family 39 protein [Deltaproteobacteria bacterium]